MIKKQKFNEKGIGLVETLIALGVALVVITALVSLSVFTLRTSTQSKLLLQSSNLVNEEVELVRAFRDVNSWSTFIAAVQGCDTGDCYIDLSPISVVSGQETSGTGTDQVIRYFRVSDPLEPGGDVNGTENLIRVSVTVTWFVGDDQKFAHSYTELSNWRPE